MHSDNLNLALSRLQAIPWPDCGREIDVTLPALIDSYHLRMSEWHTYLKIEDRYGLDNLAVRIVPTLQLPPHAHQWLLDLRAKRSIFYRGSEPTLQCLYNYLCWSCLPDLGLLREGDMSDPYEPFIEFFERGGRISRDDFGFWEIESGGFGFTLGRCYPPDKVGVFDPRESVVLPRPSRKSSRGKAAAREAKALKKEGRDNGDSEA